MLSLRFRDLAEKMIPIEKRITREKGPLNIFALFEHEDSANYLDLIVAAGWAFPDELGTKDYLFDVFSEELEFDDRKMIGGKYLFDPAHEYVREVGRYVQVEHGLVELRDEEILGGQIRRAYFITCSNWPETDGKTRPSRKASRTTKTTKRTAKHPSKRRKSRGGVA